MEREEALRLAREKGIDLIEIAPSAVPPVCKLADFRKFKYEQAKKERGAKKHKAKSGIKEIRMGPFTGEHDLEVKIKKARVFLSEGFKVKLVVKFVGRQISHSWFGFELLKKLTTALDETAKIEKDPHFEGKLLVAVLVSKK